MTNKINFTKRSIESIELPDKGKRLTFYDSKTPSLALRVTSTGTKTFVIYRKINGKPERYTIGKFPMVTIEQARLQAAEINATIAKGDSPNESKRAIRDEMTLEDLFDLFLEKHAKLHKRSWKKDQDQFNRYLLPWKSKKLSTIKKNDIHLLHTTLGKDVGIYTANRLLALIHTIYSKAIEWGWDKPNPAHGIKKFKELSRDRFLESDEIPRFFKALAEEANKTATDYFLVSLLTGARKTNVLEMQWQEINFERATWTIPVTKNGEAHTIPLVPEIITLLKQRKDSSDSPWVFPGTGVTGHLVEPKKAWRRVLGSAGIDNLRIHDLRRSLGSWQAATGANLSIIGKTLAHKNISTTAIYARLNLDPVRDSMVTATNAMFAAAEGVDHD